MPVESSELLRSTVLVHTRAAIALNNVGVSLLERGCYAQALDTLRDALLTQKHGLTATETGRIDPDDGRVFETLQRAMQRVSAPAPLPRQRVPLVVLSSENLSAEAASLTRRGPPRGSHGEVCAIRIDLWEGAEGLAGPASTTAAETALLLYNFAVAHVCLARVPALARPGHARGAATLLEAAYRVLRPARGACGADDAVRAYGLLSLEAVVLVGLLGVLLELDQVEKATSLYRQFLSLRDAMRLMEGLEQCFRRGRHSASAA